MTSIMFDTLKYKKIAIFWEFGFYLVEIFSGDIMP